MLTAEDRIVLVRVKIERAKKHLRDLEAELLAFRNNRATVVGAKFNPQTGDYFRRLPTLPFDALATAGDVVHNLRSALDHLAYQLVLVGGGKPTRHTCFPIAKDFSTYEAEKARKVQGMRDSTIKVIDMVKPYKGGNEPLWQLHELDNCDKHRTLFTVAHDYLFIADWFQGPYWLQTGDPHFAGIIDEAVEKDMQLEIDKAIGEAEIPKSDALLPSLHQLVEFVDELVSFFKPLLE